MDDLDGKNARLADLRRYIVDLAAAQVQADGGSVAASLPAGIAPSCHAALNLVSDYAYCWRVEPDGAFTREWTTRPLGSATPVRNGKQSLLLMWDAIHPDDRPRVEDSLDSVLAGQAVDPLDIRILGDGGTIRWVRNHLHVLQNENEGRITHLVGVARDITDEKRTSSDLWALLNTTTEAALLMDCRGRLLAANDALSRRLGMPSGELVGISLLDLLPPAVGEVRRAKALEAIASVRPVRFEDQWEDRCYSTAIFPITDEEGKVVRLAVYSRDVTERKHTEEAYHTLVDHSQLGLIILGEKRIMFANEAISAMTGYAREELLSLTPAQILAAVCPDDRGWLLARLRRQLERGTAPVCDELRLVRKDGTMRWMQVTANRIDYQGLPALDVSCLDVTDRREAEEALKTAKSDLEHAQRIARFGNWRWNTLTQRTEWSDGMYRIYGLERQSGPPGSDDWLEHIHPEDRDMLQRAISEALAGTAPYDHIYRVLRYDDGTVRYLHTVGDVIRDDTGAAISLVGTAQDVTDHIEAQSALRDSELRFRSIVEQSPDGISLIDENGVIVEWNQANRRMTGLSREEVVGKRIWDVHLATLPEEKRVPERLQRTEDAIRAAIEKGEAPWLGSFRELDLVRANGQRWIAQAQTSEIRLRDRTMLMIIFRDVTEQRRNQQELENRRLEIDQILRTLPDALIYTNEQRQIVHVNPAFSRVFGYEPEEVLGTDIRQLQAHPNDTPEPGLAACAPWEDETYEVRELEYTRQDDGVFLGETVGSPVRDAGGQVTGFIDLVRDVSDRKRLGNQLAQAQKMEAIGQLAGGVAHDFNNILTAIMGFTDFVLRDVERDDPRYEDLEAIRRSGERAVGLTRQLLAFSRRQMLQPRVLDINGVIANMGKMLRRLISEDIEITFALASSLGSVKVDVGQMEQVLLNLVVNAREAMPLGGSITVRTGEADVDETLPSFCGAVDAGPYVVLEIEDTGQGMDDETLAHLFEPFFTTKEDGTGLGLATVFGIVTQSSGHITVESSPGEGATFRIYLPRVYTDNESERSGASQQADHNAGTETILLVEDADTVRQLACRVLCNRGYTVLEAANGEIALRVAAEHKGEIDLLVTDVVMPGGMSGRQLAERLVSDCSGLHVLYMSGYTDNEISSHGVLDSGFAFLEKPFTPNSLLGKVRQVLDG